MDNLDRDPPYDPEKLKPIDRHLPWPFLVFFAVGFLIVIGAFSWFWLSQDEVMIGESYQNTETGLAPSESYTTPTGKQAEEIDVTIGVQELAEGTVVELLPTVAPLTHVNRIVQVRGDVDEILSASAFVLSRNDSTTADGSEILVIYRSDDVKGAKLEEGRHALVQGELLRFSAANLGPIVGVKDSDEVLKKYEGMPAIITGNLAH